MKRDVSLQTKIGETHTKRVITMDLFVIDRATNMTNILTVKKRKYIAVFLDGCRKAVAKRVKAKLGNRVVLSND